MKPVSLRKDQPHQLPKSPEVCWSLDSADVFLPEGFAKNYAYPVLIWLADDQLTPFRFHEQMQAVSDRNYIGIRIPCGRQSDKLGSPDQLLVQIRQALSDVARYANLHSERLYLVGGQTLGLAALQLVLAEPLKFAGLIAVEPDFSMSKLSLGNYRHLKHLRCLILTPARELLPAERISVELLHAAGIEIRHQIQSHHPQRNFSLFNNFIMQGIASSYSVC